MHRARVARDRLLISAHYRASVHRVHNPGQSRTAALGHAQNNWLGALVSCACVFHNMALCPEGSAGGHERAIPAACLAADKGSMKAGAAPYFPDSLTEVLADLAGLIVACLSEGVQMLLDACQLLRSHLDLCALQRERVLQLTARMREASRQAEHQTCIRLRAPCLDPPPSPDHTHLLLITYAQAAGPSGRG